MSIIIPDGTEEAWQTAIAENSHGEWDALASDMLREAAQEPDYELRDDILTLALVACELADQLEDSVRPFSLGEPA